jgi:ankyrin repeat protein
MQMCGPPLIPHIVPPLPLLHPATQRVNVNQAWNDLSALTIACAKGNALLVHHLLIYGADPNHLVSAQAYRALLSLKRIFRAYREAPPASPATGTAEGQREDEVFGACESLTLLDLAAAAGNPDVVRQLLNQCSLPTLARSALAVYSSSNIIVLVLLLKAGIPVEQAACLGVPLPAAVCADPATTGGKGTTTTPSTASSSSAPTLPAAAAAAHTPLTYAARRGNVPLTIALLQHTGTAWLDVPGREGNTPMHEAILHNRRPVARYLSVHGARLDLPNAAGWTALDLLQGRAGMPRSTVTLADVGRWGEGDSPSPLPP